ncbi:FCD domain-containing protein [bacterium]|nr:FCD domain-containing protein [bacterium]
MAEEIQFTLSDKAYHLLRRDIVSGRLVPGSRLRIAKISQDYDIGASPLREALSKLSSEFLVEFEAQRGFSVAPIVAQELRDISRVRSDLESDAITRAIKRGDDAWEANIVAAFYNLGKADARRRQGAEASIDEWEDRNREFHEALVAACDSEWVKRLRNLLYFQHERYRRISLTNPDPKRDLHAEHQAIMDATLARDAARAVKLTQEHIDLTTRAVLAAIEEPIGG